MDADFEKLLARRAHLENRLQEIIGPPLPPQGSAPVEKIETHWDHVMKELVSKCMILV